MISHKNSLRFFRATNSMFLALFFMSACANDCRVRCQGNASEFESRENATELLAFNVYDDLYPISISEFTNIVLNRDISRLHDIPETKLAYRLGYEDGLAMRKVSMPGSTITFGPREENNLVHAAFTLGQVDGYEENERIAWP